MRFVGGFFGLELPPPCEGGLAGLWGLGSGSAATFANGRSALAALLASTMPPKLWMPAYVCPSVVQAADATATNVAYFPVDESLHPDVAFLEGAAAPGDMVLAVDYFGRPPHDAFLQFVAHRRDLLFVEDAVQAVDTGAGQWGDWRLHSPRKLVGVPDGGFIVPCCHVPLETGVPWPSGLTHCHAASLRYEDEDGSANAVWHAANQRREAVEQVTRRPASRLSRDLLERLPAQAVIKRRHANFRTLADQLDGLMFLNADPAFTPFGFPIRLHPAAKACVRSALIAEGVFPACHWERLPSPKSFAGAHALAAELLTLPCDQRYGPAEMTRMAALVLQAVAL